MGYIGWIRFQRFLVIAGISWFIYGCTGSVGSFVYHKDEKIPLSEREEINELDKALLNGIALKDPDVFEFFFSDTLQSYIKGNEGVLLKSVQSLVDNADYEVITQYTVHHTTTGIQNVIVGKLGGELFNLKYLVLNEDIFISMLKQKNGAIEPLVFNVYGKYPDGWRLNVMHIGLYKIEGKNPIQFYEQAKRDYAKGHFVSAGLNIHLGQSILNSFQYKYFQYAKEEEIAAFNQKVVKEMSEVFTFPIKMDALDTKPEIVRVEYTLSKKGVYCPHIKYVSSIFPSTKTIDAIKSLYDENKMIQKQIGEVFKGIDIDHRYIQYTAYSSFPVAEGEKGIPFFQEVK